MKASFLPPSLSRRGFTLNELLVVIAILATLSTISLVVVLGAKDRGNNAAAREVCAQIATAAEDFMNDTQAPPLDFSTFPRNAERLHFKLAEDQDGRMLRILLNDEGDVDDKFNTRNTLYLKVNAVDDPASGVYYDDNDDPGYYDPWGSPYYVIYTDETDISKNTDPFVEKGRPIRNTHFLVYSLGKDQEGIAPIELSNGENSDQLDTGKGKGKKGARNKDDKKDDKGKKGRKSAEERQREAEEAAERLLEMRDAIEDNIYSWKES